MFKYLSKFRDTKKRDGVCRFFKLSKGSCGYIIACLALIVAYSFSTGVGQTTFAASHSRSQFTKKSNTNSHRAPSTPKIQRPPQQKRPLQQKRTQSHGSFLGQKEYKALSGSETLSKATAIAKKTQPAVKLPSKNLQNQQQTHGYGNTAKPVKLSMQEKRQLVKLRKEFKDSLNNLNLKGGNKAFLSNAEKFMQKQVNAHFLERHGAHVSNDYLKERLTKENIDKASRFIDHKSQVGAFLIAHQIGQLNANKGKWKVTISAGQTVGQMFVKGDDKMHSVRNITIVGDGPNIITMYPTDDKAE